MSDEESAGKISEELKRIREDEREFNSELNKYRGYDATEELRRSTILSENDEDRRAAEEMKARNLKRADEKRAGELRDADYRRASERRHELSETLRFAHEDRDAVIQPLIRGERIIRQLAIGLAVLVLLSMGIVIGLAYDTSENVKDSQATLRENSDTNRESLELLKSCVVPEDPGTCSEESAARTAVVVAQIVCYNYQYDRAFITAIADKIDLGEIAYPEPPQGCEPLPPEPTSLPPVSGRPNP